ncbi:MAG: restriction endonuclease subunit M [Oceanospirillaceae bacterium]|nr:restriction endonuclease subunit M [Oceanospirillaceae bacterium]
MESAKPIIPWMGGKRRLAKTILPMFPEHKCYVEPFCGGAAIFLMKDESKVEVINDINRDLITLYRVVKHHFEELYRQFQWTLTSRQNWEWLKSTPPETLTDIQRAARFLYLQKLAFGAKVEGTTFGISATTKPRFNLLTLERDLEACHHRLARTTIEALAWDKCVIRYDREETLFYCDPPYWQTAGYGTEFGWEQYEKLAELSKTIQGKMIISINDHPEIRKLFAHMRVEEVKHSYSVGGGQRTQRCTELVLY